MFLSTSQIELALHELVMVHPFYGITFLAFKLGELPVGHTVRFPIDAEERRLLNQYYKPDPDSQWYYRVYRVSDREQLWLAAKYASAGSQSTRTRGGFANALIHDKGTDVWGWQEDYVATLKAQLHKHKAIPAFYLAAWLYRERDWPSASTAGDILKTFLQEFNVTEEEQRQLFDVSIPEGIEQGQLFQTTKVSWNDLKEIIGLPPDARTEEGGTLALLEIRGVGPAKELTFRPAERLNLITGDNGLGKTFLLECAWWALTGQWAGLPAYPRQDARRTEPRISFQIATETTRSGKKVDSNYDWNTQSWRSPSSRPTIPGLLVYARVDGSFAVWDPAKLPFAVPQNGGTKALVFRRDDVWDGVKEEMGSYLINGLLRDWIDWQNKSDLYPFNTFKRVLGQLSPPQTTSDLGRLEPGEPVRLPNDTRMIPTLRHPYGEVPILHAAAGVRRIITLAYLIVWAWEEHKINSGLSRKAPQKRMVILIDEIEAHLHPQWQRAILPALLRVKDELDSNLQVQLMIATHSPLIMASAEPEFEAERDKLFHLDLVYSHGRGADTTGEVTLEELVFDRQGPVDYWLMSDVFGLRHPRSLEAERAIEEAKRLQLQADPSGQDVQRISDELVKYLAQGDEFWPRWLYFAEQHGVRL